jgi:shikimate kinase
MKLFLIGFMGSGKTTFGRKLAKALNYEFIDLDELIESKAGTNITQYFEKFGESAFRELEKITLQNTHFPDNSVISAGGGTPCFSGNMEWMNDNGTTVYLSLSPEILADRLRHGQAERPLIKGLDKEELVNFITEKLASREEFYKKASFIVDGLDLTVEKFLKYLRIDNSDTRPV